MVATQPARDVANSQRDSETTLNKYTMQPIAAAVAAAVAPGVVAAQDDDNDGLRVEEIVVTATKRELSMQDLGQSITAISTEDIAKQGIQDLEDVMRVLPNVSLSSTTPGRNSVIFRGISTGTQEYYTDSQVAVYLDEQPITTISQQPEMRMIDIARIESLPGPQGTLFGSSSQSGTLRYITNRPNPNGFSAEVGGELSDTKDGENNWDLNGWVNLPVISDQLAVRVAAYASHDGGYVDNVLGTTLEGSLDNSAVVEEDYNEWDVEGARIRALWILNDGWEVNLSYMAQNSSTEGAWESDPAIGVNQHVRFFKETRDDDWSQSALTLKGDLGFADLTVNASFFDRDIVYEWDNMVYEQWKDAYFGIYFGIPLYNSDYTFGTIFNDQDETSDAYEIRLASKGDSRLNWMIGGYYEDKATFWDYGANNPDYVGTTSWYAAQAYAYYYGVYLGYDVQYPLPETTVGYRQLYDNRIEQTAIFGQLDYDVTDDLTVSVGGRWFQYDRTTIKTDFFPDNLPPFGSFDIGGTTVAVADEDDTVLKLGVNYNIRDDVMLFAHYAEGFRLGGENSRRASQSGFVPETYLPDKVTNYEIGMKSTLLEGRLLFNIIGFSMQWDNVQISQSSVNGQWWLRGTINGGEGENEGVELEAQFQATDRLYMYATASFGNPKYTEDIVRFNDVVPAGSPMVWAFKEKISFGFEYSIPDVFGGDMWIGYNHSIEGEKWNNLNNIINNDPDGIVPQWDLANAHIGLQYDNGLEFQLSVRNLYDELAINGLFDDDFSGAFFGDPRYNDMRTYARPRTIGLSIRKRFE